MDGLKRYVNDDRFRVDGDKNMRLLAFTFTIVFVWTGSKSYDDGFRLIIKTCALILRNPQMAVNIKDLYWNSGHRFQKVNSCWNFQ